MPSSGRAGWMPPEPTVEDGDLRAGVETLDRTLATSCRVLIRDQADRDEIAMQLVRYRDAVGDELAR